MRSQFASVFVYLPVVVLQGEGREGERESGGLQDDDVGGIKGQTEEKE